MQAADHAAPRARVVVLNELIRDSQLLVDVPPIALVEEAALVPVNLRFDENRSIQARGYASHAAWSLLGSGTVARTKGAEVTLLRPWPGRLSKPCANAWTASRSRSGAGSTSSRVSSM